MYAVGEASRHFVGGGFGCLGATIALGVTALLLGGTFTMNFGGGVLLFVVGGFMGWAYLCVKRKGRREALAERVRLENSPPP